MPNLTNFPDGTVALLISSRTATGVHREAAAILNFLSGDSGTTPEQVSDILVATRNTQPWRALIRVRDRGALLTALGRLARGNKTHETPGALINVGQAQSRTIAMVFPGQGGQHPGMGGDLYHISPGYRATVDHFDEIFNQMNIPVREFLVDGMRSEAVQPALFTHMVALQAMWQDWGVTPDMMVGHSQGELAAAYTAGVITEEDAVRAITRRTRLSQEIAATGRYAMLIVGTDRDSIERKLPTLTGWAEVCVVNSPSLHAVAGELGAIAELETSLHADDCFVRRIEVDFPSHTHLMDTAQEPFDHAFGRHSFSQGNTLFIGSTLGAPVPSGYSQAAYWFANLRHKVRFDLAIRCALDHGATSFIEMSGHPALLTAIAENAAAADFKDIHVYNCGQRDVAAPVGFSDRLAEVLVTHRDIAIARPDRHVSVPLRFPPTAWEPDVFWAPYEPGKGTPGRLGLAPQCLKDHWEALGGSFLPDPNRIQVMFGDEHWTELLNEEASRLGASLVTEEAAVGVAMLDSALWNSHETSSALSLVHDLLWQLQETAVPDLLVVTTGAEDRSTRGGGSPEPIAAAVAAMLRCLASDFAPTRIRHLDLDPADETASSARHVMAAAHIMRESDLAVMGAVLHTRRLIPQDQLAERPDFSEAVVVGGTGVVGREVCRRLAEQGFSRVVVASRRPMSSLTKAAFEAITIATGAEVVHIQCDVTDHTTLSDLAAALSDKPRLVVHCAVNYDAVHDTNWAAAIAPKSGAVTALRKHLVRPRDRFLVFSSLSAGIGARGHATYAATNRLLEVAALSSAENTTVIRWGLWPYSGHTGAVNGSLRATEAAGLRQMDPTDAVIAALTAPTGLVSIVAADWERITAAFSLHGADSLFRHLLAVPQPASEPSPVDPQPTETQSAQNDQQTPRMNDEVSRDGHPNGVAELVERVVREALGYPYEMELDFSSSLVSLGIDSIQALTVQRELAHATANAVTAAAILKGASLNDLIHTALKG